MVSLGSEIVLKSPGTRAFFCERLKRHFLSRCASFGVDAFVEEKGAKWHIVAGQEAEHLILSQFGFSRLVEPKERRLLGGFPVGVGGKVVVLFSGGPDSVLASLLVARRGNDVVLLFLDDGVEGRWERAKEAAKRVAYFLPEAKVCLYRAGFSDGLRMLQDSVRKRFMCFFCRATMLRVAEVVAKREGCLAVATGEIMGEQASQTYAALGLLSRVVEIPLYRPLICFNKEEVFEWLDRFGAKDDRNFSMPACPFVPKRVATRPEVSLSRLVRTAKAVASQITLERVLLQAS